MSALAHNFIMLIGLPAVSKNVFLDCKPNPLVSFTEHVDKYAAILNTSVDEVCKSRVNEVSRRFVADIKSWDDHVVVDGHFNTIKQRKQCLDFANGRCKIGLVFPLPSIVDYAKDLVKYKYPLDMGDLKSAFNTWVNPTLGEGFDILLDASKPEDIDNAFYCLY